MSDYYDPTTLPTSFQDFLDSMANSYLGMAGLSTPKRSPQQPDIRNAMSAAISAALSSLPGFPIGSAVRQALAAPQGGPAAAASGTPASNPDPRFDLRMAPYQFGQPNPFATQMLLPFGPTALTPVRGVERHNPSWN